MALVSVAVDFSVRAIPCHLHSGRHRRAAACPAAPVPACPPRRCCISVPLYYPHAGDWPFLWGKEQFPVAVCLIKC